MAVHGTSFVRAEEHMKGITEILTSTACEWFLIFLLLIESVFSFMVTKFARYCELQLPCILCSRLDHVLGNEKPEFYRNLLCGSHRSEISSLVSCHIHDKLADGHGMCENCLLSFSKKNNSNQDMHRLLFGKLGLDLVGCGSKSSLPIRDFTPISMSRRWCSCCNKPWKSRQNMQRLHQLKSPVTMVAKTNIPLPCCLNCWGGMGKIKDKFSGSAAACHCIGKSGSDPLSHVGYSELKITCDSDSEFSFSDDDNGSGIICDINEAKDDVKKPHDIKCLTPNVSSWFGLDELNWQQANQKICPLPELILLDDVSAPSNTMECHGELPISQSVNPSAPVEYISLVDMIPSFDESEATAGPSPEKAANVTGMTDNAHVTINHHEDILKMLNSTAAGIKDDQVLPTLVHLTNEDPSDASKLAVSGEGREASGFVAEQPIEKQIDRVSEDLNLLLAENSSAQGIHVSMNNRSTHMQGGGDELQITNASISNGIHTLQKSVPVERAESSALESLDGSTVCEIEGESAIDWLKRQVEYDRRCMNALYKELDEERSAAAVAANQAMAMITRLQEEKAALNMDALQYLRMMEEQAEYDMEALEKANELLAEKEKQIQDLEAELEYYRLTYPDESSMLTIAEEIWNSKKKNVNVNDRSLVHIRDYAILSSELTYSEVYKGINKPDFAISSLSEFEDEKLCILECLKSLEKKLQKCAHDGAVHDVSNGRYTEEAADRLHHQGEFPFKEGSSGSCHLEENGLTLQKYLPLSNGSLPAHEGLNASMGEELVISKENKLASNVQKDSMRCQKFDVVSLKKEISDLHARLEMLEDEHKILQHTFNYLQNGNEGLPFIKEIAHQLQEIRKIAINSRCHSAS